MIKISRVLIGLALFCSACTETQKETPSGFKYTVLKAGDGVLPKKQDILVFEYVLKDSKDSVWNDTYSQGLPAAVPIGDSSTIATEKGMIQMFRLLSKGDSVKASMSIKKFFEDIGGGPAPFKVDSTLTMSYVISVKDIMNREQFQAFQVTLMDRLKTKQVSKDADLINKFLSEKNIKAEKDTSGIMYVMHKSKGGPKPTVESCVEVSYKGSFLADGQTFDQNPKMAFPLNRVILGWQRAIPLMGVGDSATFYIPSTLAYGPQGQPGAIPPNAILIFDVALLKVGNGFDQNTGACN
ncbi:MAG TPA: FKBP-type peptidyl-prolyl cis-trans isomerase [Chryseolinea sp.]|nr:FKBP-type peptidyl-prolyl cis-trans isomerase [Chryseolinea sp.]